MCSQRYAFLSYRIEEGQVQIVSVPEESENLQRIDFISSRTKIDYSSLSIDVHCNLLTISCSSSNITVLVDLNS